MADDLPSQPILDADQIDPKSVHLKHFKRLLPLLARLHDVGTARDKAGNRELFFDGYAAMVMLYLLSPLINSVAALRRACCLPKVKKKLGLKRVSAGSFSKHRRSLCPANSSRSSTNCPPRRGRWRRAVA